MNSSKQHCVIEKIECATTKKGDIYAVCYISVNQTRFKCTSFGKEAQKLLNLKPQKTQNNELEQSSLLASLCYFLGFLAGKLVKVIGKTLSGKMKLTQ